uniref:Uncharacterized protein n=1 Tax=Arundo donax TaxID=35708 RepID=A0A0A8YRJ1_ARUDO
MAPFCATGETAAAATASSTLSGPS